MRKLLSLAALVILSGAVLAFDPRPEPISPDGTRAVIDLPTSQHMRNTGGIDRFGRPGMGAGLCVFTSIEHAARWQNVVELYGLQKYMTTREGGGWPQKVDAVLAAFAKSKGVPVPAYIQHTGGDDSFLELALKTDRIVCVTYAGNDDFYRGPIAHMVNLAHLDSSRAAIIDNNRPGVWVWMTRSEFLARWRDNDGGWAIAFLADPPPPAPDAPRSFNAGPCGCGEFCTCEKGDCPGKCPVVFGQNCPNGRCGIPSAPVAIPSSCPGGRCGIPSTPAIEPDNGAGRWIEDVSGREWGYWKNGRRIAAAFADGRVEGTNEHGMANGKPISPPAALPDGVKAKGVPAAVENHGVHTDKIHAHPAYSINGVPATKEEAHSILTRGDGLRDDSDRWHLTAVGDSAFRERFKADVAALPAAVRAKLLVQSYGPSDWPVASYKLANGVTLRKPSPARTAADVGAVSVDGYSASKLGELLAAKGGPNYVEPPPAPPAPPVDPKTPDVKPAPDTPKPDNTLLYVILAAVAGWIMGRFRKD
ncbi:hypothetical protein VT84_03310 [Gemmata sp. SH-PL17]|uniref:hypothetical protein n=1 Tax=Gemmata sp. SH-PL17 TaxID=1630693 RepID=UPI00078B6FD5|nr:hypothetical protein [Gemmata sp. SH-PL17]AMV23411.1 hypothetical protein VT84_03310 [Gemmata sp. SH-PL17]